MKLASYHRLRGDHVVFVKGLNREMRQERWDRIYVTTLFSFYWNETVKTIRYYSRSVRQPSDLYVGGIMATLMVKELRQELGPALPVTIVEGLLDRRGQLDQDSPLVVEKMVPNYSILEATDYQYGVEDAYIGYATRGCVKKCKFCAVRTLEPKYNPYHASVLQLVQSIESIYGPKRDLLLLDNNVLASSRFEDIIRDIVKAGFYRGASVDRKQRRLDFNQGIDARLLSKKKIALLAETAIKPIRFAFDNSRVRKSYEKAVRLACDYGLPRHSTYVLYNFNDTPEDFYHRLQINLDLNEELDAKISSFPMKYIPLTARTRRHVGKHWHRKLIRGVQCVLLATKGMVTPSRRFFEAAFGHDEREFHDICMMPENYIIYRVANAERAKDWRHLYHGAGENQKQQLLGILADGRVKPEHCVKATGRLRNLLEHYLVPPQTR